MLTLTIGLVAAACGAPAASFAAEGPCTVDGQAAGVYPQLEARVPKGLLEPDGLNEPPTTVDSGRICTARSLSTYASHGVSDVRFAGATWDAGQGNGTVSALFETPDGQPKLETAWVEEFYETGARASTKTENIEITRPTIGTIGPVYRLETLNDLSLQTVVVWPAGDAVRVVIVATTVEPGASRQAHDERVQATVTQSAIENAQGSGFGPVVVSAR